MNKLAAGRKPKGSQSPVQMHCKKQASTIPNTRLRWKCMQFYKISQYHRGCATACQIWLTASGPGNCLSFFFFFITVFLSQSLTWLKEWLLPATKTGSWCWENDYHPHPGKCVSLQSVFLWLRADKCVRFTHVARSVPFGHRCCAAVACCSGTWAKIHFVASKALHPGGLSQ